jgi:nucleoside-diphosphate-sugar epimerase
MRVLITGGTGFIGQHLTRAALRRGWQVTLLVRRPDSVVARKLADEGASIVLGSITDRLTLQAAFEIAEPEMFFHNAGWYELGIPRRARRRMWAVNVEGTENALTMAAEHSVSKVIYTSCTTALGDTEGELVDETFTRSTKPVSYYEHTKTEAHLLAVRHQTAGEPVVIACSPGNSCVGYYRRLSGLPRGLSLMLTWKMLPRDWFYAGVRGSRGKFISSLGRC